MHEAIDEKRVREIVREEIQARAMGDLWTVRRFAKWKFETDEPTKAQVNTVLKMCQNGTLPTVKVGREWRIDTAEIMRGARNEDGKTSDAA